MERKSRSLQPENQSWKRKTAVALSGVALLPLVLTACSPKEQARWDRDSKFSMGSVPADACLVDGNPLVLNATTESNGDFSLVYVRNNGDIVVKAWQKGTIASWNLDEGGEFYWTGGKCPTPNAPNNSSK